MEKETESVEPEEETLGEEAKNTEAETIEEEKGEEEEIFETLEEALDVIEGVLRVYSKDA